MYRCIWGFALPKAKERRREEMRSGVPKDLEKFHPTVWVHRNGSEKLSGKEKIKDSTSGF